MKFLLSLPYQLLKYFLYLMLVASRTNKIYLNKLKKMSKKNQNIIFLKPISFNKLVPYSNQFDIGIQFHPPVNLNLKYGLGNKFFEFILYFLWEFIIDFYCFFYQFRTLVSFIAFIILSPCFLE